MRWVVWLGFGFVLGCGGRTLVLPSVPAVDAAVEAPSDTLPLIDASVELVDPCVGIVCAPFACDTVARTCFSTCSSEADCVPGRKCVDGSCGVFSQEHCSMNDQCVSGHCVNEVCCNTACAGPCVSCGLVGSKGSCTPVAAGRLDPSGVVCDGSGGYVRLGEAGNLCTIDADCASGFCSSNVCCNARCSGPCQSCRIIGLMGTCANVPRCPADGSVES